MAGPPKKRAQAEKKPDGSSNGSSSGSRDPTQRSALQSIPRLDGNRDPSGRLAAVEYTVPTDLKNISDFLGLAGWYTARGVSTNAHLSQPAYAGIRRRKHFIYAMPTLQTPLGSLSAWLRSLRI
jgi:eukaryotic translation initiation factor 2C